MILKTFRVFIFLVVVAMGNCLRLLSRNKTVTASSQYQDWRASRAVDGDYRNDADACRCCAATKRQKNPWFQLDLGTTEIIERIEVKGRRDYPEQSLRNTEVYLTPWNATSSPILKLNNTYVKILNYTLPEPQSSRYVTFISRNDRIYFIICELSVYGPCEQGWYGENCVNRCGQCKDADQCYDGNGTCPNGCGPGYTGAQCKQPCSRGRYGTNCTETCGRCKNGAPCNVTNGVCPDGCAPGYTGDMCKTECKAGTYGDNCKYTCGTCRDDQPCNISTGICTNGCGLGYITDYCNKTCDDGHYGDMCGSKCGQCHDDKPCNKTNGHCVGGCKAGFQLPVCTSACPSGTFGSNCQNDCGMCQCGDVCDRRTGVCPNGCSDGYQDDLCLQMAAQKDDSDTTISIPILVGAILGSILVILVTVLTIVVFKQRRTIQESNRREVVNTTPAKQQPNSSHAPANYEALQLDNVAAESTYSELI